MTWRKDSAARNKAPSLSSGMSDFIEGGGGNAGVKLVSCYRSGGAITVPRKSIIIEPCGTLKLPGRRSSLAETTRKLSVDSQDEPVMSQTLPRRKMTCPSTTLKPREGNISCHTAWGSYRTPALPLSHATMYQLEDQCTETVQPLVKTLDLQKARLCPGGKSEAVNKAILVRVKVVKDTPEPQTPDIIEELKRGSMKDKWGLRLVHQMAHEGGLRLAVDKISKFTAGFKSKLLPGDQIITINGWQIDIMDQPQVAANLIRAAGFSINLGLIRNSLDLEDWQLLDDF